MSMPASPKRAPTGLLSFSFWKRSPSTATSPAAGLPAGRPPTQPASPRSPAGYAQGAFPERQPALATLLPTTLGHSVLIAAALITAVGTALVIGIYQPLFDLLGHAAGDRFSRTIQMLRTCCDLRLAGSLPGWLAQVLLLGAASVAVAVRGMRRQRLVAICNGSLPWGLLAGLWVIGSCAAEIPLGPLVGSLISDATGITLGPAGYGWWVAVSALLLGSVSVWALLPLHERLAPGLCLLATLLAWSAAAAGIWFHDRGEVIQTAGQAAWVTGTAFALLAMLAAARSVIREMRGLSKAGVRVKKGGARAPSSVAPHTPAATTAPRPESVVMATPTAEGDEDDGRQGDFDLDTSDMQDTRYTDGSDAGDDFGTRHLSKAERKRLKKLARIQQAA